MSPDGAPPAGVPALIEHYIGGVSVPSAGGEAFEVLEPATNAAYTKCAAGQPADVAEAVAAARRAFVDGRWPGLRARQRARILNRIADAIEDRDAQLAEREAFDTGLPITQASGQAHRAAENFRFFADLVVALNEDAYRVGDEQLNYVLRTPVGVAGLITPWNTPFMLATWKLAPALAAGCTVVLKPAEWSPLSASLLPEIMTEAGVPPGVVNIVHGIGEEAGAALVDHPGVPLISFTGETTTGKIIARSAANHLKGLSMELGGKSPCVIFADADLDAAVDAAVFQIFSLNGERCTAGSRVLVERAVYDEVVQRLAARARNVRIGPPGDPATELGALIHPEHLERVLGYVRSGLDEGARLVAGGGRPDGLECGNYLAATVFADVERTYRIFQEEIFGPVLCVTPFDSEDEALDLANDTRYGLAAYLWTNDLRRAHRLAARVESGMLWINSQNVRDLRTPFGGTKESGVGREGGRHSIDFYCESRTVHVALRPLPVPRFGASPAGASPPAPPASPASPAMSASQHPGGSMGELVLAAKITHVPSIWLSLQDGRHHGIRRNAELGLRELGRRARERGVDTFVIADTHWLNSSGFHLNAKAVHEGSYASHELPHFIRDLPYRYPGDPELAAAIGAEIRASGLKSLVHDIADLGLEYGTLVPMYLMNDAEPKIRVLPIGCNMYSTIEENLTVGEAIKRAVDRSGRRVGFLASGSLSHAFPTNALTDRYLDRISADFHAHMDRAVLKMWHEGRISEFLQMLPDYNVKCSGEGAMADTGMLFGALGRDRYTGHGEQLCEYFPSTGTGQVIVDFTVAPVGT